MNSAASSNCIFKSVEFADAGSNTIKNVQKNVKFSGLWASIYV